MESIEASVTLPGGLLIDGGSPLRNAVIRPPTGREEEWLEAQRGTGPATVTALIEACLVDLEGATVNRDLARRLLAGDRDYLVLELRRMSLGDEVQAVVSCPHCDEKLDVDFRISDVPVKVRPATSETYDIVVGHGRATRRRIRFRLPTGADQEAMAEAVGPDPVDLLLRRCVVEVDPESIGDADREAVAEAMGEHAPEIDLELDLTCPACETAFIVPFDTTGFFLSELRRTGRQMLRQVHLLALHYHWTEADILSLPSVRRRRYLAMLGESVLPVGA